MNNFGSYVLCGAFVEIKLLCLRFSQLFEKYFKLLVNESILFNFEINYTLKNIKYVNFKK